MRCAVPLLRPLLPARAGHGPTSRGQKWPQEEAGGRRGQRVSVQTTPGPLRSPGPCPVSCAVPSGARPPRRRGTAGSAAGRVPARTASTREPFTGVKTPALSGDIGPAPATKPPGITSPRPHAPGRPQSGLRALPHPRGRAGGPVQPPPRRLGGLGRAARPRLPPRSRTTASPASRSSACRSPRGLPQPGWARARAPAIAACHLSAPGTAARRLQPRSSPAPSRCSRRLQPRQRPPKCFTDKCPRSGGRCCHAARASPATGLPQASHRPRDHRQPLSPAGQSLHPGCSSGKLRHGGVCARSG